MTVSLVFCHVLLAINLGNGTNSAGVDLHTYCFRHYFATTLVEKGANIKVVQELLGHTSLVTTQVYLLVKADHLEDTIQLLE